MPTISGKYLGDLRVECKHEQSGTRLVTDAPRDNHGKGESFSPTDLCATALGACAMTLMGIYAREHNLDLAGTEIAINKIMGADPRRIARLEVSFLMPKRPFSAEQRKALENVARTCPVCLSLSEALEQVISFHWQ